MGDIFVPLEHEDTHYGIFEQDPSLVRPEHRDLVGWDAFESALDDLARLSREHGFEVLAVTIWRGSILEEMRRRAAERGFEVLPIMANPFPAPATPDGNWLLENGLQLSAEDPHPSAKMHAVAAEFLLAGLRANGLLERLCR